MYCIVQDKDGKLYRVISVLETDTIIVKPEDYTKDENARYWALERRI